MSSGSHAFSITPGGLLHYYYLAMYLLVYPSQTHLPRTQNAVQSWRQAVVGVDFVTPDGLIVPRAAGEAALLGHTAVLIGGLLVGVWS